MTIITPEQARERLEEARSATQEPCTCAPVVCEAITDVVEWLTCCEINGIELERLEHPRA